MNNKSGKGIIGAPIATGHHPAVCDTQAVTAVVEAPIAEKPKTEAEHTADMVMGMVARLCIDNKLDPSKVEDLVRAKIAELTGESPIVADLRHQFDKMHPQEQGSKTWEQIEKALERSVIDRIETALKDPNIDKPKLLWVNAQDELVIAFDYLGSMNYLQAMVHGNKLAKLELITAEEVKRRVDLHEPRAVDFSTWVHTEIFEAGQERGNTESLYRHAKELDSMEHRPSTTDPKITKGPFTYVMRIPIVTES